MADPIDGLSPSQLETLEWLRGEAQRIVASDPELVKLTGPDGKHELAGDGQGARGAPPARPHGQASHGGFSAARAPPMHAHVRALVPSDSGSLALLPRAPLGPTGRAGAIRRRSQGPLPERRARARAGARSCRADRRVLTALGWDTCGLGEGRRQWRLAYKVHEITLESINPAVIQAGMAYFNAKLDNHGRPVGIIHVARNHRTGYVTEDLNRCAGSRAAASGRTQC